jgi:hypothetical protein
MKSRAILIIESSARVIVLGETIATGPTDESPKNSRSRFQLEVEEEAEWF